MKKLVMILIAVCTTAAVAMAGAGNFQMPAGPIPVAVGGTFDIPIMASGGSTYGMNLFLELDNDNFSIENIVIDAPGSQTIWIGNVTAPSIYTYLSPDGVNEGYSPDIGAGLVSTTGDALTIPPDSLVAIVTVKHQKDGNSVLTTDTPLFGPSDWSGESGGQAQVLLTPEPISVLLLMAGIPFLRRRRA